MTDSGGASVSYTRVLPRLNSNVLKRLGLTALFLACLYPASIGGISANYLFLLLPLMLALLQGRLRHPGDMLMFSISYFVMVFLVASLYQLDFADQAPRRFASFIIFMSMFSYAFVTIDSDKVAAFKGAVIAISVYFSLASAYTLLAAESVRIVGFEAKDLVGSQRFGFIYLLAIWIVSVERSRGAWGIVRYPILVVLLAGLLLTFSRSSIVAMLVTLAIFLVVRHSAWWTNMTLAGVLSAAIWIVGASISVVILLNVFPLAFEFFSVRLIGFFANAEAVRAALVDPSGSEGTRVYIAGRIIEFVVRNPLTGSGYLGVWVLPNFAAGSAHSQYLDVLFRTSFVGFFLYGCILLGLLRFLWAHEQGLFWGMFAVLVYGLFHETFKESHGAFVLAFLVGMMAQSWRLRRDARSRRSVDRTPQTDLAIRPLQTR